MRAKVITVAVAAVVSLALAVFAARRETLANAEVLYLDQVVSCAFKVLPIDAGAR